MGRPRLARGSESPGRLEIERDVESIVEGDQAGSSVGDLLDLSDDEAALLYHVGRFGAEGYPVERVGSRWYWRDWLGVRGSPIAYKTKKAAVAAFEGWTALARERWAQMRRASPGLILTAVGVSGRVGRA